MTIVELRNALDWHPEKTISIQLPEGGPLPSPVNITGLSFVEQENSIVLQAENASDLSPSIKSDRLAQLLKSSRSLLPTRILPVKITYLGHGFNPSLLYRIEDTGKGLTFVLANQQANAVAA